MNTTDSKQKIHPEAIEFLTQVTWEFTHEKLYGNYPFHPEEIAFALNHIRAYYQDILPEMFYNYSGEYMKQFCQRILLARNYALNNPGCFIPNPSVWFDPENELGFSATRKWLQTKLKFRISSRFYHRADRIVVTRGGEGFTRLYSL